MISKIWGWIGIVTLSLVITLVCVGSARAEYKSNFNYSAVMEAKSVVVIISTIGTLPSGYLSREYKSIGFSIGNGYIVALSHATNLKEMFPMVTYNQARHFIGDDKLELIGRVKDITLFRSEMVRHSIPWGDSDQLKYGTYVVIIGFSRALMINIKDGIVSIPVIRDEFDKPTKSKGMMQNTIMVSAPMNRGDSGSPVIAFKDGKPEIIGIASSMLLHHQGMNFAFHSNYVQKAIAKIMEEKIEN